MGAPTGEPTPPVAVVAAVVAFTLISVSAALECIGQFSGGPDASPVGGTIAGVVAVAASLQAIGSLRRVRAAHGAGLATATLYALYSAGVLLLGNGSGSVGIVLSAGALVALNTSAAKAWYGLGG